LISQGTLKVASSSSLGAIPGGDVTISPGGTLDLGAGSFVSFGTKQFFIAGSGVGGTGAITNSGANSDTTAFLYVTLTGDATLGGTGRYDIRGSTSTTSLSTGGHPYTLT